MPIGARNHLLTADLSLYFQLDKLLCEQARVRRERREITRTEMQLPKRPGVSQRHNCQADVPQVFGGSLRQNGDPDTGLNQHCDVLNPSELNAVVNLATEACCTFSQMSFQRSVGQADERLTHDVRKSYRSLIADAMRFAPHNDELVLRNYSSLQRRQISNVGYNS